MVQKVLVAFVVALAIPVAGFLIGEWILSELDGGMAVTPEAIAYCATQGLFADDACGTVRRLVLLRSTSFWAGITAFDLMLLYFITAMVAGDSRELNAAIFPKLIPLSLLVISALVFVEGAIVTYAVAAAEIHLIKRLHIWLVGAIGIGALVGGVKLVATTFTLGRRMKSQAFAKILPAAEAPGLWQLVGETAERVGAKTPDNIIVGLDPTFYATAGKIQVINEDKEVSGETLFLSLPMMRLFSLDELRAVIGHELGHFRGDDTAYSLKFAPVYAGLSRAIGSLAGGRQGIAGLAKLPAISMLSLMIELFARNERMISRDREFEADRVGAEVAGAAALATALGKVAVYAPLWGKVREESARRMDLGKVTANISRVFEDSARHDITQRAAGQLLKQIRTTRIAHPTDSHPTIEARLRNIDFDPAGLTVEQLSGAGGSGAALIDDLPAIERALTVEENRLMVVLGQVRPTSAKGLEDAQTDTDDPVYTLGAALIVADGAINPEEIAVAEELGARMVEDFDRVEFRARCQNQWALPDFRDTVDRLAGELSHERRLSIYNFLKAVALADGELPASEKELLLHVRRQWQI